MAMSANASAWPLIGMLSSDPIARGLFDARVTHTRFSPKPYTLTHKLTYLAVALSDLGRLPRPFLARNRRGLFSLNDNDYGSQGSNLDSWIATAFHSAGADVPDGRIVLVTLPRVAGFVFNPVSFWLCHNAQDALTAVLAEVNNTFGERHCYLCRMPDGAAIPPDCEIEAEKVFHVSPFLPVKGRYRFRFIETGDRLAIRVDLYRDGHRVLSTAMSGRLTTLTSRALIKSFLRRPFPTVQVVALIHFHAARLYLKGITYFAKPAAPANLITISDRASRPHMTSESS